MAELGQPKIAIMLRPWVCSVSRLPFSEYSIGQKIVRIVAVPLLVLIATSCESPEVRYAPAHPMSDIRMEFDWSSHVRLAQGSDNWPTTLAPDGTHYTVWGDGGGFNGTNRRGRVSLGVARIDGGPDAPEFTNIYGGVGHQSQSKIDGKSYGIIDIDDTLYMWVSPGSSAENYRHQTLYFSNDQARSWQSVDWRFESSDGLVHPTFLQNAANSVFGGTGYVYIYAIRIKNPATLAVQRPGEIVLMRVQRHSLRDRSAYEFYVGAVATSWSPSLSDATAVLQDPVGVGWNMSAVYHSKLGRVLILTEHGESMRSNLTVVSSESLSGPWEAIHYGPFGENAVENSVFAYNLPAGWIDGDEFVLVFTGIDSNDSWNSVHGRFIGR